MMQGQWPPYDPSTFRHQIQIQAARTAQDEFGQQRTPDGGWTTVRTTNASIEVATGREAFSNEQTTSQGVYIIVCRWSPVTIQPGMQIVFGSQIYRIQAVDNIQRRNEFLKFTCLVLNAGS